MKSSFVRKAPANTGGVPTRPGTTSGSSSLPSSSSSPLSTSSPGSSLPSPSLSSPFASPFPVPIAPAPQSRGGLSGVRSWINGIQLTSSGLLACDSLIGGGIPLGSMALISEDVNSNHYDTFAKYFVSEGIACAHAVCVASARNDQQWNSWARNLPRNLTLQGDKDEEDEDDDKDDEKDDEDDDEEKKDGPSEEKKNKVPEEKGKQQEKRKKTPEEEELEEEEEQRRLQVFFFFCCCMQFFFLCDCFCRH